MALWKFNLEIDEDFFWMKRRTNILVNSWFTIVLVSPVEKNHRKLGEIHLID